MHPSLHLLQAALYGAAIANFGKHFPADAAVLGIAATLQFASMAWPTWARPANLLTLTLVGGLYVRFGLQFWHVVSAFGSVASDSAIDAWWSLLLTLPWALLIPALACGRPRRADAVLLAALTPLAAAEPGHTVGGDQAPEVARAVAAAAFAEVTGQPHNAPLPPLDGVAPRVSVFVDGALVPVRDGDPATSAAWGPGLPALTRREGRVSVVAAVPVATTPGGLLRHGMDAPVSPISTAQAYWRRPYTWFIAPQLSMPQDDGGAYAMAEAVASAEGTVDLSAGWAPAPALTEESAMASGLAGAVHLARGQDTEGKFTYVVKGPSGLADRSGYNLPRHAGVTWYLGRAAQIAEDEALAAATDRALAWMAARTHDSPAGGRYVLDPEVKTGKVWVGSTALAAIAATTRPSADGSLRGWAEHVAAAVDERGQVRNELILADGAHAASSHATYAQGQGMLALALAQESLSDPPPTILAALKRTAGFLADGGYAGSARPAFVGDEHWLCIAERPLADVLGFDDPGTRAARAICDAYLSRFRVAPKRDGWHVNTGFAAGVVEAMVVHAGQTEDAQLRELALAYADTFLAAQYRPEDGPLLGDVASLIGAFRSMPGVLDVQMDVVQHTGCAMFGAGALLSDAPPLGALP